MNAILDMKTFAKASQVPSSHQAQMDLGLRLMLSSMMPPRIRGARLADSVDIANRMDHFKIIHSAIRDYYEATFSELNENLPITGTVPTADFFRMWDELGSDMDWLMQAAIDRADNR